MMKKMLVLSLLLAMTQTISEAAVLEWGDLELYEQYTLNQTIEFPGVAEIKAGERFELRDTMAGGPPLTYFEFHLLDCQQPDLTSEIIIVNPSPLDQTRDRSVGVQLDVGCNLSIWVEGRDHYTHSLFSEL